ncbi:MAG: peptide-methionine (S)-S-oxide reductase MsrA [Lysobacteraceae bacterium]
MHDYPAPTDFLPGRETPMPLDNRHAVLGTPLRDEFAGLAEVVFGMGCFWGAERLFWQTPGVHATAVGYAGGITPNPTYREVCSGRTGHAEVVRVIYDPATTSLESLLRLFWERHDPTQGMRQGNDIGTQYRSVIFVDDADAFARVAASRDLYQRQLEAAGLGTISTELRHPAPPFYYAEDMHQQYLAKNPNGYCGLGGVGVSCPLPA